ncbi:hypothetical protein V6582_06025 [Agrobacterium vitis]|uniref:hypothetical protein n=1 Tax=Agrobacterium vitis TaxID=373 RepID=UPI0012E7BD01|nr:hypothetical protein [Agrobacterium vitis]MVA24577.1 hypothetical protein [Agrobacterium vitis]
MNVDFQDIVRHGISFKYSPTSLSSLTLDELRHLISELNALSEQLGCVVFEGDGSSKTDLVIFGGNLERFSMLSVARGLGSRVFYFQDTVSWWYGGSNLLPDIDGIAAFLQGHIGNYYIGRRPCLVFGQSSGGYAALALGAMCPHYDVLACSPQTFPDAELKRRLNISPSLAVQHTPDYLFDIEDMYRTSSRTGMAAAIFSASEFTNPYHNHFWMDHLHMAKIAHVPSIDTFLAASSNHSIVFQRARLFSEFLKELAEAGAKRARVKREIVKRLVHAIQPSDVPDE